MDIVNTSNINFTDLDKLNDERRNSLMPGMIFLCFVMVTGILGNVLVVLVYGQRYQLKAVIVYMIALGVSDLLMCSLCLPFEIYNSAHQLPVVSHASCLLFRFLETFLNTYSVLILVCVAIDRFLVISRPQRPCSLGQAKSLFVVMFALTLTTTWPQFILPRKKCSVSSNDGLFDNNRSMTNATNISIYQVLSQGTLTFLFCVCFIISLGVYGTIAVITCRRRCTAVTGSTVSPSILLKRRKCEQILIARALSTLNDPSAKPDSSTSLVILHLEPGQTAMMLFIVTLSTLLCYCPFLGTKFLPHAGFHFQGRSTVETIVYQLCRYSYFLNNVLKPVIYSILSPHFRRECLLIIRNIFVCKIH